MSKVFEDIKALIKSDLHRYAGLGGFCKVYRSCEGFKYTVWLRIATGLQPHKRRYALRYLFAREYLHHLMHKYGISIDVGTKIGPGFYIGHFGGIVVNGDAVIGRNCNISHCVTIGQANRGPRKGIATIGDNVYIGPGAKIIGAVTIGNDSAIGANAVVTKDVPDGAVVAGIPAQVISMKGSEGYVENRV